jgi:hypothetical protein
MLTCFIRNNFRETSKDIAVYSILLFPLIYVIFSIYTFIRVFRHRHVSGDSELKSAVVKYLIYSLLYIVFYFPSIILYLLSINQNIPKETFLSWFSYFCSLATISINTALCLFRILEGYVKCHWKALFVHQKLDESLMSEAQEEEIINEVKIPINDSNAGALIRSGSMRIRKLTSWKRISVEIIKGVSLFLNKFKKLKNLNKFITLPHLNTILYFF